MAENRRRRFNITPPPSTQFNTGGLAVEESLVPTPRPTQQEREDRQTQRELGEEFGNIEFEADLYSKGFLDPLSRLGLDAEVAKTIPARWSVAGLQVRGLDEITDGMQANRDEAGYSGQIESGDVLTVGDYSGSNTVWTHEFRHRGMEKLLEGFDEPSSFIERYLSDEDEDTKLVADLVLSGREEELLIDYMDRRSPEERGFDMENLSDDYSAIIPRFKEPLAKVEEAIMQAARDRLDEEGVPRPAEMRQQEEKGWLSNFISNLFGRERGFNKGGLAMDDQMKNLLEEGGLTDDGMKKDPVSGNDVPSGSMAEEVRDDIDARLSEGEYVVPADVVRYYGVKFFEDLRGQAKEDLNEMEESGRIGGEPVEMAAGGMVQASNFNPNIPSAQTPAQMPQQGYALGGMVGQVLNSVPNFANQPTTTQNQNMYLQTPYASLADLFADFRQVGSYTQRGRTGAPAPTTPTAPTPETPTGNIEYRTYVGPNGEIMMIPFLNGEPQITIPAGFRPQGDVSQAPQVQTGGDGDGDRGPQAPQGPQTTEQRLAEIDAALEDVNYEDPLGAGAAALEGGKGVGSIAGTVIGLLAAGPMGARLGNALGGAVDSAGSLADAAVNAEVASILGYDTTELDASINSKLNEMGVASRPFAESAILNAREKAREAIFNVDSPYALTRDKFQSDQAFEAAMTETAPTGMTYDPNIGGYTRDEPVTGEDFGGTRIDTGSDDGPPVYAPGPSTTRPQPRPDRDSDSGGGTSGEGGSSDTNVGNWGGDRDGDGVANAFDFDDGVGWADSNRDTGGGGDGDGGGSCFLKGTPVTMEDGTYKAIEDIKLNDVIKGGGKVFALGQFINDEIYKYKDIYVSGSHLVKENGKWLRVRDSNISVPYSNEEHTVYVLGTEDHIIEIKDVTFSDYFEVHAQELLLKYQDDFFDFYKSDKYMKESEEVRKEILNSETTQQKTQL